MEIQKVKEWKINKGKQFKIDLEVIPSKIIYSSAVEFIRYALRLRDDVKFYVGEFVKYKDLMFTISCFHKDCIHVDIKGIELTFTIKINDIIKL